MSRTKPRRKFKKISDTEYIVHDNDYYYSRMNFKIVGDDIKVEMMCTFDHYKQTFYIEDYKSKTALDTIRQYNGCLGRIFDEGLLRIYHDLGLPLGYVTGILKNVGD